MLWLGLHFPCLGMEIFPADADAFHVGADSIRESFNESVRGRSPLLRQKSVGGRSPLLQPQVLVEDNRVILRNAAAAEAGVALGSTLATAHSIVPGLRHRNRDEGRERQRLRFLAEVLYRFTSQVSMQPPHGLLLEVSGSLNLFGGLQALQQQVRALCESLGHRILLQAAGTPLAALTLARSRQRDLHAAGLQHTELDAVTRERLANMGIHTLGPLLALPETGLAHRFGAQLLDYLRRLTGRLPDPREGIVPWATFASSLHLLEAVNDKNALLFPMQRLSGELQAWLAGRQLGAERICWRLRGSASEEVLPVSFAEPQQSREAFLGITRLKLEQAQLPEDVLSLALAARHLAPWRASSQELFQPLAGAVSTGAGELVDRLRARLGDRACYGICVVDQHSPEQAWGKSKPEMRQFSRSRLLRLKRPLWLFDPPRAVDASELILLRGPERIQTAWWQHGPCRGMDTCHGMGICRDYYVARHRNGAECWAFVNAREQWYLHGYFA